MTFFLVVQARWDKTTVVILSRWQVRTGKDGGASALAKLRSFSGCVLAEYVWLDADGVTRSKTMTMTARQGHRRHRCERYSLIISILVDAPARLGSI